jgi:hypothetical protein
MIIGSGGSLISCSRSTSNVISLKVESKMLNKSEFVACRYSENLLLSSNRVPSGSLTLKNPP